MEQTQDGDDACSWRQVFDGLLVFEQDFDTAMQILMFQDEKVARLSLEDSTTARRKRAGRRAKSRGSSARSPSRKRRRTETNQSTRAEPPTSPFSSFTQSSDIWSSVESTAEAEDTTQASWMPSCSLLETQENTSTQTSLSNGCGGVGGADGNNGDTSGDARSEGTAPTTAESSGGDGGRDERIESVGTSPTAVSSLFQAHAGKATCADNMMLEGEHAGVDATFQERSSIQTLGISTANVLNFKPPAVDIFPTNGCTYCPDEGQQENNSADVLCWHDEASTMDKSKSGLTKPSLFQTASGRAVEISKARLVKYTEKMIDDVTSISTAVSSRRLNNTHDLRIRSVEESVVASAASEMRDVHGAAPGANAAADRGATVPSLFQTGSGKAVSVSKARLQAYEAKLRSEEESVVASTAIEMRDVHGIAPGANAAADRGATVPSLFQTGSGKAVSVSKARLQIYEAKLRSEEESVVASTASEMRDVHGVAPGADAAADRGATVPSLFQTGSGKAVSVSKARLQAYEAKLRSEEESVVASAASEMRDVHGVAPGADAAADRGATVPSLFQTGSGKAVSVSKARLQAYEAKLRSEEESVVASTASEMRDVHGVAPGADAAADRGATVPSLFQTGSGKAVSVSKARLQTYEAELRSEEESVVASTASEMRDVHGVAPGADAAADRGATVPSLFQTGSGKAVSVSKARLQAYEAKLRSEEESVVASAASEMRDVHGVAPGANAAADRGATVPSLFQTGSGKAVSVSKAGLQAYEAKLRSEEESVVASTASEMRDVHGVAPGADAAADRGATVPSLFQTGSGKAVSVSKARLQIYEAKLRSEEESVVASTASEMRDVHGVAPGADAAADRGATVPSLFQTGSGKAVSVSKARLQAYEAKLRSEEESVVASAASEMRDVHGVASGANAAADRGATVPSLFQTGSGKAVSVSKARLQAYEAKLRSEEESVVASTASEMRDVHGVASGANAAADRGATVPSLFQTGSGKAVSVSKARLQIYEAKLRSEEESVVASTASEMRDVHGVAPGADAAADRGATVPSLFQTGSGKAVSVSKARLQAYEAKLRSEEESVVASTASEMRDVHGVASGANAAADRGATVPSLFQTGSGKAVSVSKARLQAYEAKLRSEEESVVASTASEMRDVHGVAPGADAAADRGATVPSLFQTGSGKAVSVSKARLQTYEAKLRSEEESVVASTASEMRDVHGVAPGADAAADRGATVPSLFQTGSGKAVSVSKARLQAYEAKLRSEEESVVASAASEMRDVHGVAPGANAAADRGATVPSLFQTGSGKAVSVSKARLQAYEAKLRSEEESVVASTASEMRDVHGVASGANAAADRGATVPSLFQTGSGKAVSVSKARLQIYEAKLRSEEESVVASTASEMRDVHGVAPGADAAADRGATVPSLFQTGSGKAVSVSKARLQAYEAKLRSEEESVVASTASEMRDVHGVASGANAAADRGATVPSLFQTGSGKAVSVSKARLQIYEAKLRSEEESVVASTASEMRDVHGVAPGADAAADRGATVPSLFQTGSGKAVSVSKARLQAYEAKLRSEEESVVASTASEMRDVHGVTTGAVAAVYRERVGLRELDETKVLRTSQHSLGLQNRPLSASKDPERDGGDNGVAAILTRSFLKRHSTIDGQSRQDHGLSCGDKENVHPENILVRMTAALEASKSWQSGPRSTQLNSALPAKFSQHQLTRQPFISKRSIQSSTLPSRARMSGKKRFHPPVASKKTLGIDAPGLNNVRYPAVPTTKKQKVINSEAHPFIYSEAMKISFRVLVGLHEHHTFPAPDWELPQFQVLTSITAESAVHVGFSRDGDLVRFSDCSYDGVLFSGPRELFSQLKAGGHILETSGATFAWFLNHYRWIVWKLAATERSFSRFMANKYLTREQVMKQITHRYRRELNNSQRPILKKVLQRDSSSLNCMVLCIAAVLPFRADNNTSVDQELPACWNMSLVLTDGWYAVYAVPDAPLATVLWKLHTKSSLVGTKIATWNAILQNSTEGIEPLECAIVRELQWKNPLMAKEDVTQWPYLQLRYNSTRRVRFDTRLGVEKLHYTLPTNSRGRKQQPQLTFSMLKSVPLKSLEVGGGMVRSVRIRVTRISPVLHLQAKEWTLGPRILCEEQLPIYFQLRAEYGRASMRKKIQQSGVENGSSDWVDDDQVDVPPPIPFIKVDVECTHTSTSDQGVGCGILTIWRPSEELLSGGLREGAEYFASSLTVNWKVDGGRGQDAFLRLSSTKHTNFEEVKDEKTLGDSEAKVATQLARNQRVCVDVQQATTEYRTNFESDRRNERRPTIDVCVCVVMVTAREMQDNSSLAIKRQAEVSLLDPAIKPKESRYVEHVFVTDQSRHLMSIRVAGMEVSMLKKKTSPLKRGSSSSFAFRRGNKSVWKEGAVFCLSGLEVSHYDEQLRVLDCVLVESTQIVSFPSKKSLFWGSFQYLQREARILTSRRSAPEPLSDFPAEVAQLKNYVEREILRMDFVASQECDEHHVEVVEQERLTQDLQAHEEGGCDTSEQANESPDTQNRHLRWGGTVVKVLPLLVPNKHIFPCDVIALVCVNIRADDNAFRTVYLSREVAISMRALLQGTDAEQQLRLKENEATDDGDTIVQSITEMLTRAKLCKTDSTFQFEVRQATNERLINSWKPWERLHASYWVANTVTHLPK